MIEMFICIDCGKREFFIYEDNRCKSCFYKNNPEG